MAPLTTLPPLAGYIPKKVIGADWDTLCLTTCDLRPTAFFFSNKILQ